jgi:hypothetical protein
LMVFAQNHGEGGSSQVPFPPLLEMELLDMPIERFLSMLRFEQRGNLD